MGVCNGETDCAGRAALLARSPTTGNYDASRGEFLTRSLATGRHRTSTGEFQNKETFRRGQEGFSLLFRGPVLEPGHTRIIF